MIIIGLGANLPTDTYGPPRAALGAALAALAADGFTIKQRSPWYESAPVPMSEQPWYVNGVCELMTDRSPDRVIQTLLELENRFGRVRSQQNAPRILDLDLLAYEDRIITGQTPAELSVPHPRMYQRAFVILPLQDIAPDWTDPVSGRSISDLAAALPKDQQTRKLEDANGVYGTEWQDNG